MRRIIKDKAPQFWETYIRTHPKISYNKAYETKDGQEAISDLREHMLSHQKFICCYCCTNLGTTNKQYHNEHIKPKGIYTSDSMRYENLLVSCTSNSCGMSKKNTFDEKLFVSPLQPDCETHFLFQADGYIVGLTPQGEHTIDILNLNCSRLVNERRALYNECCRMAEYGCADYIEEEYISEKSGHLPRYVDMVKFFFERGTFSALSPNI